ncbi:hypothetical protein AXX12_10670 [Anaerosporomusa subterranea]|uniref:DUF1468 domain-containing protein n=1 Tax=Anaerosporomusa subterranea TaxID=1794912 RepID=A0A154BQ81_ANASB|nr:tripartite tricarboxylate transporter TctB family protein [Anaerosporomusa subterranea]KYZ75668.1 hypothetical protein AXX12_10670 [Anaerosporomusa subterranea]
MKNIEVYVSAFFILVGGVFFYQASEMQYFSEYGPGPGLLPMWVTGFMVLLAAVNLVMSLKRNNTHFAELMPKGTDLMNLITCIGSFILFMLIVEHVGFAVSSILMLFILFLRGYKWYWGLGMSIVVTGVSLFIFGSVLGIPLPVNQFGW